MRLTSSVVVRSGVVAGLLLALLPLQPAVVAAQSVTLPAAPAAGEPVPMPVAEPAPMPLPGQGTGTYVAGPMSASRPVADATAPGLGREHWLSYEDLDTGDQGSAGVNVANGNLVVQQVDSAPVQAHGRLSYTLRRTYNSQQALTDDVPWSVGSGWSLNLNEAFSAADSGNFAMSPAVVGLVLGDQGDSYVAPTPITLADRDGTRHLFTPKIVTVPQSNSPVNYVNGSGEAFCLGQAYTAPAGVQLSMFSIIGAVKFDAAGGECYTAAEPKVAGYVTMTQDRIRTEFDADGRVLTVTDGAGVMLSYLYDLPVGAAARRLRAVYEPRSCQSATDAAGVVLAALLPAACRAFRISYAPPSVALDGTVLNATTVTDPAGRTTVYRLEGVVPKLVQVDNPDGSTLGYTYDGHRGADCAPGLTGKLCSVRDGRGASTRFGYDAAPASRVAVTTDRRGTVSAFSYEPGRTTVVEGGVQRRVYDRIDAAGRVGERYDTDVDDVLYRHTSYAWDNDGGYCRARATPRVDHRLCRLVEHQVGGEAPSATTTFTYSQEGNPLIVARTNSQGGTDVQTYGYRSYYWGYDGENMDYLDTVAGGGQVTDVRRPTRVSYNRQEDTFLPVYFVIVNRIQSLSPRGNAAPETAAAGRPGWRAYVTTYSFDDEPNRVGELNSPPPSGVCNGSRSRTGLVCSVSAPSFEGDAAAAAGTAKPTVTRYTYDTFGQRVSMTTPKAVAETPAGTTPPAYRYDYYADDELDLSGQVSAGGWLRRVTDPTGKYVAFGYDRGGNVARTWDRNATTGRDPALFPGSLASPPPGAPYSETLRFDVGGGKDIPQARLQQAYEAPWRFIRSERTPLGDRIRTVTDANGNAVRTTPPRGTQLAGCCEQGPTTYDWTRTYEPGDLQASELAPAEAAANGAPQDTPTRYTYDAFGNPASTTDPAGAVTTYGYDRADRAVRTSWTRGPTDAAAPRACRPSTPADAPIPAGSTVCSTHTGYDGLDNIVFEADGNSQVTTHSYDALQRRTATISPRNASGISTVREQVAYDADGNVTDICPPREFTEPDASKTCTATSPYSRHATYDAAGRLATTSTYRAPGAPANTTRLRYDADGNETGVTDAKGAVTTIAFDLLDRRTAATQPRSATESFTTGYRYDGVGNLLTLTHPVTATTTRRDAYSYDVNNRLVDTVTGSTSPDAAAAGPYDPAAGTNVRERTFYDADGTEVAWLTSRAFSSSVTNPNAAFLRRVDVDADGRTTAEYTPRYDTADPAANDPTGDTSTQAQAQAQQCPTGPAPLAVAGVPAYPATVGVCITRTSYDNRGLPTARTWPTAGGAQPAATARKTTYRHTDDRLLAAETGPSPTGSGTATIGYRYDGEGRQLAVTDPLGHTSTSSYTSDGLLAATAEQGYTQRSGAAAGTTITHTTSYGYDPDGQQTSTTNAKGETAASSYYADGLLKQGSGTAAGTGETGGTGTGTGGSTPELGDTSRYEYDQVGNPIKVFSPSAVARDATNPSGTPAVNTFAADDLLLSAEQPPGTGGTRQRTAYRYDGAGRKLEQTTSRLAPAEASTAAGTPAGAQAFEYDPAGRITRQTGRQETAGSARPTITTSFDAAGNALIATNTPASGPANTIRSTYYLDNTARTVDDGRATTRYGYTGSGKPATRIQASNTSPTGPIGPPATRYAYNDADLPTSSTATAVPGSATTPWTWTYDAAGRTALERHPNGQQTQRTYNPDDTLLFQRTTAGTGSTASVVTASTFSYDGLSRRTRQDVTGMDEQGASSSRIELFQYNAAGRVTGYDDGDGMHTATWDANGNRLRYTRPAATGRPAVDERATYNPDDSLATSATTDDTGTPTSPLAASYTGYGALKDDGCTSYTYDGFDRTATANPTPGSRCATALGTSSSTTYTYDGLDRQRSRTQTDTTRTSTPNGSGGTTTITTASPAETTDMLHDGLGATVAAETKRTAGSTSPPVDSAFTLDPDNNANAVTSSGGTSGSTAKNNYLTDDGHGTVATITNDSAGTTTAGFVACAARLDPWGKPRTAGSPTSPTGASPSPCKNGSNSTANDKFYRGLRRDGATGTYQMGSRTYNPTRAAFLSQDTYRTAPTDAELGVGTDPLTMNRYTYVNGDPVNYADPDGHKKKWYSKAARKALAAGKEVSGYNDIKKCVTGPTVKGCAMAAASFTPAGKAIKAAKLADRGLEAGQTARKAKRADRCATNSFTPDTLVLMADGNKRSIAKIKLGDLVLASDPTTGRTVAQPVTALIEGTGSKTLVDVTLDGAINGPLTATDRHPFWVGDKGWTNAQDLKVGDQLRHSRGGWAKVSSLTLRTTETRVHNLTVAELSTYHVGDTQPVLVHNCPVEDRPGRSSSGRNDPHGKQGGAAEKAQGQLDSLQERLAATESRRERKALEQKIKNVKAAAARADKGETHSRRAK